MIFISSKKRNHFLILLGCALLGSCCDLSRASAFDEANKLYYEGKFSDAASAYEKLIHSGTPSPALYYNLGNAWFKSGQIGRAIWAYKKVERYSPRDPDLQANLQFARNQTQGPTLKVSKWHRSIARLTLNEWTLLASGSIWVLLLLISASQWRPAWGRSLRGFLIPWIAVCLILCACLAAALSLDSSGREAVVISSQAVVRNGPLEESKNAFTLNDGAEVRVLDHKENWLLITTDPKRTGWVRNDQVLMASR